MPTSNYLAYRVLDWENQKEFDVLHASLIAEHLPSTPTERFLILEMARAEWRLARVPHLENDLLTDSDDPSAHGTGQRFSSDFISGDVLRNLSRYEASARRAWHRAFHQLRALRAAPKPLTTQTKKQFDEAKPIPPHLQRELDAHRRRDPLFDPVQDRSQVSKAFRKWLETHSSQLRLSS